MSLRPRLPRLRRGKRLRKRKGRRNAPGTRARERRQRQIERGILRTTDREAAHAS